MKRYLTYWGKAQPLLGWRQTWHPAAYHCLDVAAAGACLLETKPLLLSRTCERIGMDWDGFVRGTVQLLAIHDLAKLSDAFQLPLPSAYDGCGNPTTLTTGGKPHHTHLLQALLAEARAELDPLRWPLFLGWSRSVAMDVLRSVSGHHGQPPLEQAGSMGARRGVDYKALGGDDRFVSVAARRDMVDLLADIQEILPADPWPVLDEAQASMLALALAGFVVQADWIGSSKAWFPYMAPTMPLERYWKSVALPRARQAVEETRLTRTLPVPLTGLSVAFPEIEEPRPMQVVAESLPLSGGQCLIVVEDVTGSGKTEAAIVLAHRMIAAGMADGIFIGLPTMATSNAMFRRVTRLADHLYPKGSAPDIVLSHGGSTRERKAELDARARGGGLAEDDGEVADYVETWAASDRRSALLCDLGVATIDQALLAVLASKHQSLRLHGLAGKILIIDEAHSYDRYVFEELLAVLRFHAFLGGSAIVMSATLPLAARAAMFREFKQAARWEVSPEKGRVRSFLGRAKPLQEAESRHYPALHMVSRGHQSSREVKAFPALSRFVAVSLVPAWEEGFRRVEECLRMGGCACVIRSTVDEAIATYETLMARGLEPLLLHARFMPRDRASIETTIMDRYGPDGEWSGRAGGLVVATQVIEQSLDLDFDLMVSDLAPIELLIQRAGRIGRHVTARRRVDRPLENLTLTVVTPDPDEVESADWLDEILPGAAVVYQDHGALWRTARALKKRGGFSVPGDVRDLVEECSATGDVPHPLRRKSLEAEGDALSKAGVARSATLSPLDGYRATGPWLDDTRIQTRMGMERRPVRLGVWENGQVRPLSLDGEPWDWSESTVDVSARKVVSAHNPGTATTAVETVVARWPIYEREIPLIVMEQIGPGRWRGTVSDAKGDASGIHYVRGCGLVWRAPDP